MSENTAVTRTNPRVELRNTLDRYAPKLAVFGVNPDQYIEAALMACVKTPALLKCTPESVALSLRQAAQTGLSIGRTAHLVPFSNTCTFVPDYKGLIELAIGTHKVKSIRTRCVYEGEQFQYSESGAGPDISHSPRLKGTGGVIVGAYAIADLQFGRFKVEWMTFDEIEKIRAKSKSWANGSLEDWYGRKTVVRRLCKTLPSSKQLQMALAHDDAEPDEIPGGEFTVGEQIQDAPKGYRIGIDYSEADAPIQRHEGTAIQTTNAEDIPDDVRAAQRTLAAQRANGADPYEEEAS